MGNVKCAGAMGLVSESAMGLRKSGRVSGVGL